ncbi:MAG: ester cyclase [Actinomycetota bacterium]|nr:ester cyclase [Actinomycetota bacterium]
MPEENKRRVRRFWEHLFDERGWSVVGDIVSPEVVFRGTLGKEVRGIEGLRRYLLDAQAVFPDLRSTVNDLVAEEDRVVARLTFLGTQGGELFGVAPTGRQVAYEGIAIHKMAEGRIAECWALGDILGLLRQLGAAPKPQE